MRVVLQARRHFAVLSAFALLVACNNDDDFTNIVVPVPVATTLSIDSASNNQTATVGAALPLPLQVTVFDQNGAPLPGAVVNWSAAAGILSASSSVTDANGNATVSYTTGTTAGAQSVQASIASGATATFNATATARTFNGMLIVSGQNQIVQAGSMSAPMVVRAVDVAGNPVAGVVITWTTSPTGTLSAISTTTDANGLAQVTLLTDADTRIAYAVTATVGQSFVQFNLAAQ